MCSPLLDPFVLNLILLLSASIRLQRGLLNLLLFWSTRPEQFFLIFMGARLFQGKGSRENVFREVFDIPFLLLVPPVLIELVSIVSFSISSMFSCSSLANKDLARVSSSECSFSTWTAFFCKKTFLSPVRTLTKFLIMHYK